MAPTMYAHDTLGVATSSFTCSANGTCQGTTATTQTAFLQLQGQINRVGVNYGITKLAVDGKLGPATLRSAQQLTLALSQKLGSNLDRALEDLLIETGSPTTTKGLALNAEAITDALSRDGIAPQAWSVLTTVKDVVSQIVAAGGAAPTAPPPAPSQILNPYPATVPTPATTPFPATAPNFWAFNPNAPTAAPAAVAPARAGVSGWAVAAGVGTLALIGGIAFALLKSSHGGGISSSSRRRLGCACR